MATYGGFNYTNFKAVNLRTTGGIRFEMDGGKAGTLAVTSSPDANRQWYLPNKSGIMGITGTFTVSLPTVSASDIYSTIVTVSGIRVEDGLVCTIQDVINSTARVLLSAVAGNENITLYFVNYIADATARQYTIAYTAVR